MNGSGITEVLEAFDGVEELLDGRGGYGFVGRQGFYGIEAQAAVAFELRFVEPLVGGGFVREGGIFPAVGQDIGGDAACDSGFYVEQFARRRSDLVAGTVLRIVDGAEDGVALGQTVVCQDKRSWVDGDFDAEIAAAFSNGVSQVTEGHTLVGVRVGGNDVGAAAAHQFVDAEIFEVAAVGDINVF